MMSDLYLNEECCYFEENTCDNEVFAPPFFKKRVVMTAMRKKLNLFTLQLLIYYLLY